MTTLAYNQIDLGDALLDGDAELRLPRMTADDFWAFCLRNPDVRAEREADGTVILMAPSGSDTDSSNAELTIDLGTWNRSLPMPGKVFGPSAGFTLPNGATKSPDAAWIAHDRWQTVPVAQRDKFAPICPDFVVEVLSPSDTAATTRTKMEEYIANGARLAWMIDRKNRRVHVFRPGQAEETIDSPATMSAGPELPGLTVDMNRIF
jgi:Uma2 family endonuclease